ncbi:S9 family peptidase [Aurantivibrio plasticivorans]
MKCRKSTLNVGCFLKTAVIAICWLMTCSKAVAVELPELTRQLFSLPDAQHISLSPGGRYIASIARIGRFAERVSYIEILDTETGERENVFEIDANVLEVGLLRWLNNESLLIEAKNIGDLTDYKELIYNRKKREFKVLQEKGVFFESHISGDIISILPEEPDHILVRDGSDFYKININTGGKDSFEVLSTRFRFSHVILDNRSWPRLLIKTGKQATTVYINDKESGADSLWKFSNKNNELIEPLGFDSSGWLYAASYQAGRPLIRKYDVANRDREGVVVAQDKISHALGKKIVDKKGNIIGLRAASSEGDYYFSRIVRKLHKQWNTALSDLDNTLVDISIDNTKYIILSSGLNDPGTYYFGDSKTNSLVPFAKVRENLDADSLPQSTQYLFDEEDLQFVITRPVQTDKQVPLVVLLDGRVVGSDTVFSNNAKVYASAGYAVLEVAAPIELGSHRYAMWLSDVDFDESYFRLIKSAVEKTLGFDYVDANNSCVVGFNYDSYFALRVALDDVYAFKCIAVYNAITDPHRLYRNLNRRSFVLSGLFRSDDNEIKNRSPINNVYGLKTPILMLNHPYLSFYRKKQTSRFYKKASKYGDEVDKRVVDFGFENGRFTSLYESLNTDILEYLSKHLDM